MSDHIVKIIPAQVEQQVTADKADCVLRILKEKVEASSISVAVHEQPAFIDCGSNLDSITCPHCGAQLDFGWWGEAMSTASEGGFEDLSLTMPCCDKDSSLNDLRYEMECGFAYAEFHILNPKAELSGEILTAIERQVGRPVRVIHAHI